MKSRLFFKVFGTYLLIMVLSVSVVALLVGHEIRKSATARIGQELMTYAGIIDLSRGKEIGAKIRELAGISQSRVTLIDASGRVTADSERAPEELENHLNRPEIQEARVRGKGSAVRFSQTLGVNMLYVAVALGGDPASGYVRLARPLHEVENSVDNIYHSFFAAIFLVIPLSFVIAFFFSYRLASPIIAMEQYTEKLRKGEVSGTLLVETTGEMKQLAANINYLVVELQDKIRQANEEKGKLIAAFASMTEGVLVLNHEDRIETFNRSFRHLTASRFGDVMNKTLIEAFRNVELQGAFERFKETHEPVTREVALGESDPVIVDVSITAISGPPGEGKTMIVFHDVTRLKKLEQMRVDFVANVTHEIRTPLTAIIGFVETLQGGAIEDRETARQFLDTIGRHAQRLNRLVEDLLTLSAIELGEMKFVFTGTALNKAVENVLAVIEARAGEKHIDIKTELPGDLPPLWADPDRLVQVLLNILDNAVKFTPTAGKISLSASAEEGGFVAVKVADTGIGIPKEEIPRLGERFYRVDKARSREMGGTGLGLSIVKHLLAAHGGRMEIESQVGKGTVVSLFFPVARPS